ncbi:MAG: hypothetical protein JST00_43715 [Deltaproteobacteria bacterium]|nr:hypothetical protein [Deltaproteobacteria bacterium]
MLTTQKISVAMGREELRLAKTAARAEGLSLSAYITSAVRERLEERRRMAAARELLATFAPEELPTADEEKRLLALWARPTPASPVERRSSQHRPRRRAPR